AEAVITYQSRGGADETGHVTGRHEQAAFAIFDELWQTTDRERNRRNAQSHRIDHRRAQTLRAGGMPEHIQARHGIVNFLDESGVESFHSGYGRPSFSLSAKQDEAGAVKNLCWQNARYSRHHVETFLLRHPPDDATDYGTGGPATLTSPVA